MAGPRAKGRARGGIGALHARRQRRRGAAALRGPRRHRLRRRTSSSVSPGCCEPLARDDSPFAGRQPPRGAHFVEPRLVCEVEFSEWTKGGPLRQPSYKGLREDKPADDGRARARASRHRRARLLTSVSRLQPRDDLRALIAAGRAVRGGVEIEVEGRTLKLTNLDKVALSRDRVHEGRSDRLLRRRSRRRCYRTSPTGR